MIRDPAAWSALATVLGALFGLLGIGVRLTMVLTRLVDTVRDLNESMKDVVAHVGNHESRITMLEAHEGEATRHPPNLQPSA